MAQKGMPEQVIVVKRRIRVFPKKCPVCGKDFTGPKIKVFCSRACVRKATYQKHGEEYRKQRREKYHAEKKAAAGKK